MAMREIRILFTGGGSGGHVYPLIAVHDAIAKMAADDTRAFVTFHYMGPNDPYAPLLAARGITLHSILAGKVRRYASFANIIDTPKFIIGFFQSLFFLYAFMPDVIFSKGGTGAFGVVLAGWFYRIPVIIHESDAVPGLNNLLSARFARRIAVSFEAAARYFNPQKTVVTGTPLRAELFETTLDKNASKESLGFAANRPLVFIYGGSQGSKRINEFILSVLPELLPFTQILHQTGSAHIHDVEELARAALLDIPVSEELTSHYRAVPYLEEKALKETFTGADLVLSRAGSGNIAEIAAFGKPAILVPLKESAGDHQRLNAYAFAERGGGIVIEEENLLQNVVVRQIKDLVGNKVKLEAMGIAARAFSKGNAAGILAEEVIKLALS